MAQVWRKYGASMARMGRGHLPVVDVHDRAAEAAHNTAEFRNVSRRLRKGVVRNDQHARDDKIMITGCHARRHQAPAMIPPRNGMSAVQ